MEQADKQVARDQVGDSLVSTVFLGLDMDHWARMTGMPHGPVLWETMIFGGEFNSYDLTTMRYRSRDEAIQGHKKIVQMLTS